MVYQYKAGLGNVGSYQVAGKPFVSGGINCAHAGGGAQKVEFPSVTSWVAVANPGYDEDNAATTTLKVGFSKNGVDGTNYFSVKDIPATFDVKVTEVWVSGSTDSAVMAGLTSISKERINNPSISTSSPYINWSGSSGV
jgi:hypothetical protein